MENQIDRKKLYEFMKRSFPNWFFGENVKSLSEEESCIFSILRRKSSWFRMIDMIKLLYCYLKVYPEANYIKEGLIRLYLETDDFEIKEAVKAAYNGTLDISDIEQKTEELKERIRKGENFFTSKDLGFFGSVQGDTARED